MLVSAALGVFFDRMLYYFELAERTAMEATVMHVNSALAVRSAQAMMGGPEISPAANPFELAGSSPPNFLGVLASPDLDSLERGKWVFDSVEKQLVYLPRYRRNFSAPGPEQVIRYRTLVDGKRTKLVPTSKYTWQ